MKLRTETTIPAKGEPVDLKTELRSNYFGGRQKAEEHKKRMDVNTFDHLFGAIIDKQGNFNPYSNKRMDFVAYPTLSNQSNPPNAKSKVPAHREVLEEYLKGKRDPMDKSRKVEFMGEQHNNSQLSRKVDLNEENAASSLQ